MATVKTLEPTKIPRGKFFADICANRLYDHAVEIGVDIGLFAEEFLPHYQGTYVGIDPWLPYADTHVNMMWNRDSAKERAEAVVKPYGKRASLIQAKSVDIAATGLRTDFVYVDGAHDYMNVIADCRAWWPLLCEDGLLAGHDWDIPDVVKAVTQFAEEVNRDIVVIPDARVIEGQWTHPSWMIERRYE